MEYVYSGLASLAVGILAFIVKGLLSDNKKLRDEQKQDEETRNHAIANGVVCLLRVQLIEYHSKYMRDGFIPSYAFENFKHMYDAYRALGGNGLIKQMWEDIQQLDIRNHKE